MKLYFLTIVFLFSGYSNSFGQEDYPPCSAFDSIGKDSIYAINSYSNTLYLGIDNEIKLSEKFFPYKNILVECSSGMAMEDSPFYLVYPSKTGAAIISVYQWDNGDTNLVLKKAFNVQAVPAPAVSIRHVPLNTIKEITKNELLKEGKFEVHFSDDIIDDHDWFSIKEITMGYPVGQLYKTLSCPGPKFSNEMINAITKLLPGKEVSFAFILAGQGDLYKRVSPIKIKVY